MNPLALSQMTGLPPMKKAPRRGGRKSSGKPGAEHLGAVQRAHAAGDFKAAKRAALDYANAVHKHIASETPEEHAALTMQDDAARTAAPKAPKANDVRTRLAKLALGRKK